MCVFRKRLIKWCITLFKLPCTLLSMSGIENCLIHVSIVLTQQILLCRKWDIIILFLFSVSIKWKLINLFSKCILLWTIYPSMHVFMFVFELLVFNQYVITWSSSWNYWLIFGYAFHLPFCPFKLWRFCEFNLNLTLRYASIQSATNEQPMNRTKFP